MSSAIDLVSLADVQIAYPNLGSDELADVPSIITAVSALVARRYPRAAIATNFDETHDIAQSRTIALKRRPVIQVYRIRADLGPVLSVTRTDSARRALVQVVASGEVGAMTATSLTLDAVISGVAQSTVTLSFATYVTVGALASAINGVSNWSAAVVPGQSDMATIDLEPFQGPKLASIGSNSTATSGAKVFAYTRDLQDWSLNPVSGEITILEYRVEGYRYPDRTWGADPRSAGLRVLYQAGNLATPPDVKRAVTIMVADVIESTAKAGPVAAESSDDYSYRLDTTHDFSASAIALLSPYKDRRFN